MEEITIRFNKETLKGFFIGIVLSSVIWVPLYGLSYKKLATLKNETKTKETTETTDKAVIPENQPSQPTNPQPSPTPPSKASFDLSEKDHYRGKLNAPIKLVEFSDFQCPYCARHHPTMKKILETYGDKVVWVYKHFPLSFHPYAEKAALASECASEQGKFWEYADKLTENQANLNDEIFVKLAKELKLKESQFKSCLDSEKYKTKVQGDLNEGIAKGVEGTPTTFVNGEAVVGAVPFENFKAIIDQVLNENK
jgi:protein-disulfide isomerase